MRLVMSRVPRCAWTAGISMCLMVFASRSAHAQLSLIEAATDAKKAFDFAKGAYDAYKAGQDFLQPSPSVADLIADAVLSIETLTIDTASANAWAHANKAIQDYQKILHSSPQDFSQFDSEALSSLLELQGLVTVGKDVRYAHILGPVFNSLLPLYFTVHLAGRTWGSTIDQATLESTAIGWAQTGLQLDYDMIGGIILNNPSLTDTTMTSALGQWITASSTGGPFGTTSSFAAAYFQTDPSVQAIQRSAADLVAILQRYGADPTLLYDTPHNMSVRVDLGGWTNNWRGVADGVWTAMEPYVYGVHATVQQCPRDFGMRSVRQMDHGLAGYLCTNLPGIPVRNLTGSQYFYSIVNYTCSGSLCGYVTRCASTDIASSAIFGSEQCVHRLDYQSEMIPIRGAEQSVLETFSPLPAAGAYFDLPAGTFLTGIDPTDYSDNNFVYYYAPVYPSSMAYSSLLVILPL